MAKLKSLAVFFVLLAAASLGFEIQPKILYGELSNSTDIPFFADISVSGVIECSASVLSDRWILTAAHCLAKNIPLRVRLGIRRNHSYKVSVLVDVGNQYIYPGFFNNEVLQDIALIKLPQPVVFGRTLKPTKLPLNCEAINESEPIYAIGAGVTEKYRNPDGRVRQALLKETSCRSHQLTPILSQYPKVSSIICSSSMDGPQVPYLGDSGGPMIRQSDGIQFGLVKAKSGDFQVFTKVSHFFNWIAHTTGLNLPNCPGQAPAYR